MEKQIMNQEPIEAQIVNHEQGTAGPAGTSSVAIRNNNNNIAAVDAPRSVKEIVAQVKLIQDVMREVMQEGEHYGTIPGCGDKKALLQPGAQKLCMTFRLTPEYVIQEVDLPGGHKEYRITCTLKSIGSQVPVGQGVGSCSSMESKYRYRGGTRKCPECGKEAIIMGKRFKPNDPEPGWLCWATKGGCGSKWDKDDEIITGQSMEKQENPNPADTFNTVLKMAKKRAFVDATITATAASDIFTQDVGDPEEEVGGHPQSNASKTAQEPSKASASTKAAPTKKAAPAPGQAAKPPAVLTEELANKWRDYFLAQVKKFHVELFAYAVAMEKGLLVPGVDKLTDISLQKLPVGNAQFAVLWDAIQRREQKARDEGGMPQDVVEAFDKAYAELPLPLDDVPPADPKPAPAPPHLARSVPPPGKAINVPRDNNDPDSPNAPWRSFPKPFGTMAGTKLADLPKNHLFGLWANFEVTTEFNGKAKSAASIAKDEVYRAMLDEAGKHYEFSKSEDEREREAAAPPEESGHPIDDDVPF